MSMLINHLANKAIAASGDHQLKRFATRTPDPGNSLPVLFMKGEYATDYRKWVWGKLREIARRNKPETTRISIGDIG
jgi:hypothetical protein